MSLLIFLLNYFSSQFPTHVHFVKAAEAIVRTSVSVGLDDFWGQRKRWASKISSTMSGFTLAVAVLAWFVHFGLLIQFWLLPTDPLTIGLLLTTLMIKVVSEYCLISSVNTFFGRKERYAMLFVDQVFYCTYIALVGITLPFSRYLWKGRSVR